MPNMYWSDTLINQTLSSGSNSKLALLPQTSTQREQTQNLTIIRTIIRLDLWHDRDSLGVQSFDLGVGVMGQVAFADSAPPDPSVQLDYFQRGYMWRARYAVLGKILEGHPTRIDKDIRSKRKIENGVPALVFSNDNIEVPGMTVNFTGIIRLLVKFG